MSTSTLKYPDLIYNLARFLTAAFAVEILVASETLVNATGFKLATVSFLISSAESTGLSESSGLGIMLEV